MAPTDQNAASKDKESAIPREPRRIKESVEKDPFLCTCGPCRRFWKATFTNTDILEQPVINRAQNTSTLFQREQSDWRIKVGDQVIVQGLHKGIVRYVGLLDENIIAPEVFVGVQLYDNSKKFALFAKGYRRITFQPAKSEFFLGSFDAEKEDESLSRSLAELHAAFVSVGSTHNGMYNGKRYFHCPRGHGAMVPYCDVRPLNPPEERPPLTGNSMFPSYTEVAHQRRLRRQISDVPEVIGIRRQVSGPASGRILTVYDSKDVAYQDAIKTAGHKPVHADTTSGQNAKPPGKPKADPVTRRYAKWKEDFGGGDRGERLVKTLRKLHECYEKGVQVKADEVLEDDIGDESAAENQQSPQQQLPLQQQQQPQQYSQQLLVLPKVTSTNARKV